MAVLSVIWTSSNLRHRQRGWIRLAHHAQLPQHRRKPAIGAGGNNLSTAQRVFSMAVLPVLGSAVLSFVPGACPACPRLPWEVRSPPATVAKRIDGVDVGC